MRLVLVAHIRSRCRIDDVSLIQFGLALVNVKTRLRFSIVFVVFGANTEFEITHRPFRTGDGCFGLRTLVVRCKLVRFVLLLGFH